MPRTWPGFWKERSASEKIRNILKSHSFKRKHIMPKKTSTAKRKIPSSKFPKAQGQIPSRKLPTGTSKIASRKIPNSPSGAKKKTVAPLPDRPAREEERHDRIENAERDVEGDRRVEVKLNRETIHGRVLQIIQCLVITNGTNMSDSVRVSRSNLRQGTVYMQGNRASKSRFDYCFVQGFVKPRFSWA
jgi:hypothetical protein